MLDEAREEARKAEFLEQLLLKVNDVKSQAQ